MFKTILAVALLATATTSVFAQSSKRGGTPEEQRACAPDVSRLCRDVMNDSDLTILGCLKANRAKVGAACNKVLVSNGQ